jgi:hypothetical protein
VEYFQAQSFGPLRRRAFFLIKQWERFVEETSQRVFFFLLTSFAVFIYGIRGAGYRKEISGDDLDLFFHAINRPAATSVLGKLDHFGLFDPYNGYLVVLLRAFTHIALLGPDTSFTLHAYVLMTLFFAVTTAATCSVVCTCTSRTHALFALLLCLFMPFSNLVILAQVNTVAWPLALLMMVVTATRTYPTTQSGQIVVVIVFALTAMSTGTVLIALIFLAINLAQDFRKIIRYELILLIVTAISFLIQWFSYSPRTNPKLPLLGELHKVLFNFSPQFIREKIGVPLNVGEQMIFWIIPITLSIIWLTQANHARKSGLAEIIPAVKLLFGGTILLCLLVRGNGWFNTHYLFIPASTFWISLVLLFHKNVQFRSTRKAIALTATLFATTISGVYYLI